MNTTFNSGLQPVSNRVRPPGRSAFSPSLIALLLVFGLGALAVAQALPYQAGGCTAYVDVRNAAMTLIPHAKVSCWVTGQTLNIEARAAGYVSQKVAVSIAPGVSAYKQDFTLADLPKTFAILDLAGKTLQSAHTETGQYGFPAEQYGITILIPAGSWPRPSARNIEVFDPNWVIPLKTTCTVAKRDEFYQVRVALPRETMAYTASQLIVAVDTTTTLTEGNVLRWVNALIRIENLVSPPAGAALALAKFLFYTLPERQVKATGRVPKTLQALYSQRSAFASLHQDSAGE